MRTSTGEERGRRESTTRRLGETSIGEHRPGRSQPWGQHRGWQGQPVHYTIPMNDIFNYCELFVNKLF